MTSLEHRPDMTAHNAEVREQHLSAEIPVNYKNALQIHAMRALGGGNDPIAWMETHGTDVENALDTYMKEKGISADTLPPEKEVLPYVLNYLKSHENTLH